MSSGNRSRAELIAGVSAILAGTCWLGWVFLTNVLPAAAIQGSRTAKLIQLLMTGWNLLLIPAALQLQARFGPEKKGFLGMICGIVSLSFWAYGGSTNSITPALEITYLLLSGFWWTSIGIPLFGHNRALAFFTVLLAGFAVFDACLSFLEPIPFYIYVLAAPKLPLSIAWDFWVGIFLLNRTA